LDACDKMWRSGSVDRAGRAENLHGNSSVVHI
jgi:hypothetical protein